MENIVIYINTSEFKLMPYKANNDDAGYDLMASEDIEINGGETVLVPTGLRMAIPVGYEVQIRPRSGISFKTPLRIPNSPGTIDSGYRDEVKVIMENTGNDIIIIKKGERIAQMVVNKLPNVELKISCRNVKNLGEDRGGGFGSSGIKGKDI